MRRFISNCLAVSVFLLSVGQAGTSTAGLMFWTDGGSVWRSTLEGSSRQVVYDYDPSLGHVNFIDIDRSAGKLYQYGRIGDINTGYGFVRRSNLDGSGTELLISGGLGTLQYGFALDSFNSKMYIGGHYGLKVANLDGTGLRDYFPVPHGSWPRFYPHDIEIDIEGSKLYYSDALNFYGIGRVDLATGTGLEVVVNAGARGSTHMALDVTNNQLYFSTGNVTPGLGLIGRASLDSSNVVTLIPNIEVYDIELDAMANKIYWTTLTSIQRANIDGSVIETLITLNNPGPWHADSLVLYFPHEITPVPEPSTVVTGCIGSAVLGIWLLRRGRRNGRLAGAKSSCPIESRLICT